MSIPIQYNNQIPVNNGGDPINQLPTDKNQPSLSEAKIINSLFEKNYTTLELVFEELKDSVIFAILFIIISLPQIDNMIYSIAPITKNSFYFMLGLKAIIIVALHWLIKHYYLSQRRQ